MLPLLSKHFTIISTWIASNLILFPHNYTFSLKKVKKMNGLDGSRRTSICVAEIGFATQDSLSTTILAASFGASSETLKNLYLDYGTCLPPLVTLETLGI